MQYFSGVQRRERWNVEPKGSLKMRQTVWRLWGYRYEENVFIVAQDDHFLPRHKLSDWNMKKLFSQLWSLWLWKGLWSKNLTFRSITSKIRKLCLCQCQNISLCISDRSPEGTLPYIAWISWISRDYTSNANGKVRWGTATPRSRAAALLHHRSCHSHHDSTLSVKIALASGDW